MSYNIFGFNEFALRLPSALSVLFFLVVLYRLVRRYSTATTALLTVLILLGCRAVVSFHVGRTGDFDGLLLLMLTCSMYYFCRYFFEGRKYAVYLLALFTGLAFYTKGTAGMLYLPGMFIFLLVNSQLLPTLQRGRTYIAMLVFALMVASWMWLVYTYGKSSARSVYGTKNSIETMFIHDTYKRLASDEFSSNAPRDNFFFFHSMEVRMNMWHILFYLAVATGLYLLIKNRKDIRSIIGDAENKFTMLCLCLSLPVILIVNFAEHPLDWYFTPAWPLIAFITARWMMYVGGRWRPVYFIWGAAVIFNLVKHFLYIDAHSRAMHDALNRQNELLKEKQYVVVTGTPRQNLALYLHWMNMGYYLVEDMNRLKEHRGQVALVLRDQVDTTLFEPKQEAGEYCVAVVR